MNSSQATQGMKTFMFLWFGQTISIFGSALTGFALGVWVFQRTESATSYALLMFFATFPSLLASPIAGALVDRWDRRRIMLLSDTGSGLCTGFLALLIWRQHVEIWQLFVILAISSLFRAFQMPALNASIAQLVPKHHLGRASGMSQMGPAISQTLSPLLAGVMIVTLGLMGVLWVNIGTFLIAIFILLIIRIPRLQADASKPTDTTEKAESDSLWQETFRGWRYIKERPGLLGLLVLFAATNVAMGAVAVLLGPLVMSFASPTVFGTVVSVATVGAVLGGLVISIWGGPQRRILGIFSFMLLQGAMLFVSGLRANPWLIATVGFVFLLTIPVINGCSQAIWLAKVPKDMQGRVFALRRMVAMSLVPIAYLVAGPLAEHVFEPLLTIDGQLADSVGRLIGVGPGRGIGLMFIILGCSVALAAVLGFSSRRLRGVDALPDAADDAVDEQTSPEPTETSAAPETAVPQATRDASWLRILRPLAVVAAMALALVLLAGAGAGFWFHGRLQASLPRLDGDLAVTGLDAPVEIDRDALGIPTLRGGSRRDVAFAIGFLHGQERFFQMDLQRRQSAGELSELFGSVVVPMDRSARIHRFRSRATGVLEASAPDVRRLLEAYAAGVNAGLDDLGAKPFEYIVLRSDPVPWRPEDSVLTLFTMFTLLQGQDKQIEKGLDLMRDVLPEEVFRFLAPPGSPWDAPLIGEPFAPPAIPGPEVVDLRGSEDPVQARLELDDLAGMAGPAPIGSNNWAVAGSYTRHGGALVANDMHLPLSMPNIWYRASLSWPASAGGSEPHRISGVTLPGAPLIVVGSNGHVAWGFTNSRIDTTDLVGLELDPEDEDRYLTAEGPRRFERDREVIRVKGGASETLEVVSTVWGPLLPEDHGGRRRALSWVAHEPDAVNFELFRLEQARDIERALDVANRSGLPAQNFVVADATGSIGWTIAGKIPRRFGFDGQLPSSWADGTRGWDGLLASEEVPRIIDPESGRLWTANNRVVSGEMLSRLGNGGYVSGARAGQIRDQLFALEQATTEDLLRIQLDDRALFLKRWRRLWLELLTPEAIAADSRRGEFRQLVESWGGHASADSVGYRLVRGARLALAIELFDALTARCKEADSEFVYLTTVTLPEAPLWQLVSQRPPHLLKPRYSNWDEQLLAAVDRLIDSIQKGGERLSERSWGQANTVSLRHPLSLAIPLVGRWLDTPEVPLPGDNYMPRVQVGGYGAAQRMVVSPGREEEGILHMPGGQSGHPLSANYRDSHSAWVNGEATPFLPGPTVHQLTLAPVE